MRPDDETLMAYVDGELSPAEAARVESAIAADPEVAKAVERARALREQLRMVFDPILDEPVPGHLLALAAGATPASAQVHVLPVSARRRWGMPEWSALAAALVLGVGVSQFVMRPATGPFDVRQGVLVADGNLARSLESRLSAEPGEGVSLGLSFRDSAGRYCRGFHLDGDPGVAGLACRDNGGRWKVPVAVATDRATEGGLRQASSALPEAVLAVVDSRIAGEPLDAAQERQARDSGWR